jgi:hypothetical protein
MLTQHSGTTSSTAGIVVAPEVLNAGLSMGDLGLYVKVEQLLAVLGGEATASRVVHELVVEAGGPMPGVADNLQAGIERLAAAGFYNLDDGDLTEKDWCAKHGGWPQL